MKHIFLGIGSNLKNPLENVQKALLEIQNIPGIYEFQASPFYKTTPVSNVPQPHFLNAVVYSKTILTPFKLFEILCKIEIKLGKTPKSKQDPRIIDIDLLIYEDFYSSDPKLTLPHPRMFERLFVLQPLYDLISRLDLPLFENPEKKVKLKPLLEKLYLNNEQQIELINSHSN